MRAHGLLTLAVLLLATSTGCWVWDELSAGEKELDRYSGKPPAAEAKAPEPTPAPERTASDGQRWWKSARSVAPRDGTTDLVRCRTGGSTTFTRAADCQGRGGTVLD